MTKRTKSQELNTGDLNHMLWALAEIWIWTDLSDKMSEQVANILKNSSWSHAVWEIIHIVLWERYPKDIADVLMLAVLKIQTVYWMDAEDHWSDEAIQERFDKASQNEKNKVFATGSGISPKARWCRSMDDLKSLFQENWGIQDIYGIPEEKSEVIEVFNKIQEEDKIWFIKEKVIKSLLDINKISWMYWEDAFEDNEFEGRFNVASQDWENIVIVYPSQTINIAPGICNSIEQLMMYFQDGWWINKIYSVPKKYFRRDWEKVPVLNPNDKVEV